MIPHATISIEFDPVLVQKPLGYVVIAGEETVATLTQEQIAASFVMFNNAQDRWTATRLREALRRIETATMSREVDLSDPHIAALDCISRIARGALK